MTCIQLASCFHDWASTRSREAKPRDARTIFFSDVSLDGLAERTNRHSSNRGLFSNHYDANEAGGHRKSSGVVGRSREGSSEHKGRTFELLLYNSQTWTYMCKRVRQVRHVGEKRVPTQCAGANQNACAVPKIEKGCKKGRIELTTLGCWKRGKPVLTITPCDSAFRT